MFIPNWETYVNTKQNASGKTPVPLILNMRWHQLLRRNHSLLKRFFFSKSRSVSFNLCICGRLSLRRKAWFLKKTADYKKVTSLLQPLANPQRITGVAFSFYSRTNCRLPTKDEITTTTSSFYGLDRPYPYPGDRSSAHTHTCNRLFLAL